MRAHERERERERERHILKKTFNFLCIKIAYICIYFAFLGHEREIDFFI